MRDNTKNNSFHRLYETVISKQLCCGCGTCVGVCPHDAICFSSHTYYPEWLDENKCSSCGFCVDVCPGGGLPLDALTKKLKTGQQKYNTDIGNYKEFLVGYSKDDFIRSKSASGGIATSLLLYALDKKIVDKVIVVVNDEKELAKPIVKITACKEDVLASMQSKYVQVPLNTAIKEMLRSDLRYGVVGLPCHLEGLHLAQAKYKKLQDQVIFMIGLLCGYSYPYECVNTLLRRMNLRTEEVDTFLGWREGDYFPGHFSVRSKTGETASLSFAQEHYIDIAHYALFRCFLCIDGLSQLADISLGDSTDRLRNKSFVISRTNKGHELLESAKTDGYVDYHSVDAERALTQGTIPFMLREKRHKVLAVIQYLCRRNTPVPDWDIKESKISKVDRINAVFRIWMVTVIRKTAFREFLRSHPKLMEVVGGFIYQFDIRPKYLASRTLKKVVGPRPKLMAAIRFVYHICLRPKHTASRALQKDKKDMAVKKPRSYRQTEQ